MISLSYTHSFYFPPYNILFPYPLNSTSSFHNIYFLVLIHFPFTVLFLTISHYTTSTTPYFPTKVLDTTQPHTTQNPHHTPFHPPSKYNRSSITFIPNFANSSLYWENLSLFIYGHKSSITCFKLQSAIWFKGLI